MVKYEEYKNVKVEELKQRDIDFDVMKNQLFHNIYFIYLKFVNW